MNETVLILDDDISLLENLTDYLEIAEFSVLTASNGIEGLARMDEQRPDIIVCDIMMPEMDGYAFFEQVRDNRDWLAIPFVFLSAKGDPRDIQSGYTLGVDHYMKKPFDPDELITLLRSKLQRAKELNSVIKTKIEYKTTPSLANPFISIMELEPIKAEIVSKAPCDVSYSDIVIDSSGWLPSEILDAFSVLEGAGFDIGAIARNLSVILALMHGELKSKLAIQRWFSTGQVEVSQGQTVHLASIGRLAREIRKISTKITVTSALNEEKIAEFREASGKRKEKVGATIDRLELSLQELEDRRKKTTLEFEELINLVADYLGVGGMK